MILSTAVLIISCPFSSCQGGSQYRATHSSGLAVCLFHLDSIIIPYRTGASSITPANIIYGNRCNLLLTVQRPLFPVAGQRFLIDFPSQSVTMAVSGLICSKDHKPYSKPAVAFDYLIDSSLSRRSDPPYWVPSGAVFSVKYDYHWATKIISNRARRLEATAFGFCRASKNYPGDLCLLLSGPVNDYAFPKWRRNDTIGSSFPQCSQPSINFFLPL